MERKYSAMKVKYDGLMKEATPNANMYTNVTLVDHQWANGYFVSIAFDIAGKY